GRAALVSAPSTVATSTVVPRKNATSAKASTGRAMAAWAASAAGALSTAASPAELLEREAVMVEADAGGLQLLDEAGAQPGGLERPQRAPALIHTHLVVEDEQVLQGDDVTLHPDHLGNVGDPPRAVLEPGLVDD